MKHGELLLLEGGGNRHNVHKRVLIVKTESLS